MTSFYYAQFLILLLLTCCSGRVFFIRTESQDSFAILPLISWIVSFFNIAVYGINATTILLHLLSIWVFIWNVRALLRLFSGVIIDRYSGIFMLISIINFFICIALAGTMIYFHPNFKTAKNFKIIKSTESLSGNFENGFQSIKDFQKENIKFYKYFPSEKTSDKNVLFIPPKNSSVETYDLFLSKLANDGFNVFAAEFFTNDADFFNSKILSKKIIRQTAFQYFMNKDYQRFVQTHFDNKDYLTKEFKMLLDYSKRYSSQNNYRYIIADKDLCNVLENFMEENIYEINGYFDLASIKTYTTPGIGPVENTDPTYALSLKIIPDKTNYMSMHLASSFEKSITHQR